MGYLYVEYCSTNRHDWYVECFDREFFGYFGKFRLIYTPKNF